MRRIYFTSLSIIVFFAASLMAQEAEEETTAPIELEEVITSEAARKRGAP